MRMFSGLGTGAFATLLVVGIAAGPLGRAGGEHLRAAELVSVRGDGAFSRDGKPWHPFGCNYFDPHVGWAPKLWREFAPERVEKHFGVLEDLGVNVVRVFLTAQSFFADGENLDAAAIGKLDRLLEIARRHRILVHPTGPDHWEGTPAWRRGDIFADPEILDRQVRFWKLFAARYRGDPTIFAYDLLNEPHIGWGGSSMVSAWRSWLRDRYGNLDELRKAWGVEATELESLDDPQVPPDEPSPSSRRLGDFQEFRQFLSERWVKAQASAIRSADPGRLVTVGLIQWSVPVLLGKPSRYATFLPSRIEPLVDFLSVHFYPLDGDPLAGREGLVANLAYLELVLRYVRGLAPGKPLVVGEFGWYGGGAPDGQVERTADDQVRWCRSAVLQGRGLVAGWLNWAYADTPTSKDITRFSGLVAEDDSPKPWGNAFRALARSPDLWTASGPEPVAAVEFPLRAALVDPAAGDAALRRYTEAWKAAGTSRLVIER